MKEKKVIVPLHPLLFLSLLHWFGGTVVVKVMMVVMLLTVNVQAG